MASKQSSKVIPKEMISMASGLQIPQGQNELVNTNPGSLANTLASQRQAYQRASSSHAGVPDGQVLGTETDQIPMNQMVGAEQSTKDQNQTILPMQQQSVANVVQSNQKQQIIIVSSSSGPPPNIANSSTSGQGQAVLSNLQGGGQAISLSGLTAQQLSAILQAYGVVGSTPNANVQVPASGARANPATNDQTSSRNAGQEHLQSISLHGAQQNPVAMTQDTNIIVVSNNHAQQPQLLPQQNLNAVGHNLQQQLQQLQQQNQLMRQQIIANGGGSSTNPQIQHVLGSDKKRSSTHQSNLNELLIQNLNQQYQQQQKQQMQQQQINNLVRQLNQMRNQQQQQHSQNSDLINSSANGRNPAARGNGTAAIVAQLQQMGYLGAGGGSSQQSGKSIMGSAEQPGHANSSAQGKIWASQQQAKLNFDPNKINIKLVNNQSNPDQGTQNTGNSQPKKKKGTSVIQSRVAIEQIQNDNSKSNSKKNQQQKAAQNLNGLIGSNDESNSFHKQKQQELLSSGVLNHQRQHYQSATQRQKSGTDQNINSSAANAQNFSTHQGGNNPPAKHSKPVNSPQGSRTRGPKAANAKEPPRPTTKEIEILDIDKDKLSKLKTVKKQKKGSKAGNITVSASESAKGEQIAQVKGDEKQKLLQVPKVNTQSTPQGKNSTSARTSISGNNTRNTEAIASATNKNQTNQRIVDPAFEQTFKALQSSNQLSLPPPPPAMTAKEKKKLKQEVEREKERLDFEKNFKASDLQISKMGLNVQKTFITRPNAIIVYHQDRLVKLDITSPSNLQQSGAVPQPPSVQAPQKPLLITPEELHDFYNHSKVEYFTKVSRALEVFDEPKYVFKEDQQHLDKKMHSTQERKIKEVIDKQLIQKKEKRDPQNLAKFPIIFPSGNIKDSTIFFNSRFESGNLREVEKINEFEYNLFVNFDFNSSTHSQWFYFSVRNIRKSRQYKFNICNLQKDESCFQIGMKPFVYSTKRNREAGTNEWKRGGEQVCYYKNKLRTKVRECAPDYEFDEDSIPCYEYEDEASQMVSLNTLSFCYEFEYENDITFFAYFQPYTLSDLQDYLFQINKTYEAEHLQNIYKCEELCTTLGGNPCYVLTITDNVKEDDINVHDILKNGQRGARSMPPTRPEEPNREQSSSSRGVLPGSQAGSVMGVSHIHNSSQKPAAVVEEEKEITQDQAVLSGFQMLTKYQKDFDIANHPQKQTIFLSSRVHPGESNASFMIQGAIDFLLQRNNKEAKLLRETFIFKIIPMLNPDGVINGNYRCNFIGADLNRRWPNPSKLLHPTIYYTKKLLKMCHQDNQVLLFCDFHGHTRKRNVFMYGCVSPQTEINQHKNNNLIRIVPYLLDQKNKLFSFADCKFANEREKESTGRLVMFKEFGILNSYTIESTFYSHYNPRMGQKKRVNVEDELQIKTEELLTIGHDFCEALTAIINSKILKRKFIIDTATPLGSNVMAGQGGFPLTQFLLNQANEHNQLRKDQNNSSQFNQANNIKSVIQSFVNGPSSYSLIGSSTSQAGPGLLGAQQIATGSNICGGGSSQLVSQIPGAMASQNSRSKTKDRNPQSSQKVNHSYQKSMADPLQTGSMLRSNQDQAYNSTKPNQGQDLLQNQSEGGPQEQSEKGLHEEGHDEPNKASPPKKKSFQLAQTSTMSAEKIHQNQIAIQKAQQYLQQMNSNQLYTAYTAGFQGISTNMISNINQSKGPLTPSGRKQQLNHNNILISESSTTNSQNVGTEERKDHLGFLPLTNDNTSGNGLKKVRLFHKEEDKQPDLLSEQFNDINVSALPKVSGKVLGLNTPHKKTALPLDVGEGLINQHYQPAFGAGNKFKSSYTVSQPNQAHPQQVALSSDPNLISDISAQIAMDSKSYVPSQNLIQANDIVGREFRAGGSAPNTEHPSHIVTQGLASGQFLMYTNNEEDTPLFPGSQSLQSDKFKNFANKLKMVDHQKIRRNTSNVSSSMVEKSGCDDDIVTVIADKTLLIQDTPSPRNERSHGVQEQIMPRDKLMQSAGLPNQVSQLGEMGPPHGMNHRGKESVDLVGPDQMSIIDQYVNTSHHIQSSKKRHSNQKHMEAATEQMERTGASLEASLVEQGSRMSHTEHKKGRKSFEKKNTFLKKSQTQAYNNIKNNSFNYNDQFFQNNDQYLHQYDNSSKKSLDQVDVSLGYHRVSIEDGSGGKFLNQFDNNGQVISSNTQQIFSQPNDENQNRQRQEYNSMTGGFFSSGPQPKIRSAQSSSSQNPPTVGIQRNAQIQIDMQAPNENSKGQNPNHNSSSNYMNQGEQYSNQAQAYLGLRGQKSKSSLSLTNQTNIIQASANVSGALSAGGGSKHLIGTAQVVLNAPLKTYHGSQAPLSLPMGTQQNQQELNSQAPQAQIMNSAPMNSRKMQILPTQNPASGSMHDYLNQTQVQNFCVPNPITTDIKQMNVIQKQNQLQALQQLALQQHLLQQRKQQAEQHVQQLTQNIANARQNQHISGSLTLGDNSTTSQQPLQNNAAINFKLKYNLEKNIENIKDQQMIKSMVKQLKKPGSTGKAGMRSSAGGNGDKIIGSVLPNIVNSSGGHGRLTQNMMMEQRPNSQNRKEHGHGHAGPKGMTTGIATANSASNYPYRNIFVGQSISQFSGSAVSNAGISVSGASQFTEELTSSQGIKIVAKSAQKRRDQSDFIRNKDN